MAMAPKQLSDHRLKLEWRQHGKEQAEVRAQEPTRKKLEVRISAQPSKLYFSNVLVKQTSVSCQTIGSDLCDV